MITNSMNEPTSNQITNSPSYLNDQKLNKISKNVTNSKNLMIMNLCGNSGVRLRRTATHCNALHTALQHAAAHSNALQHTATHCNTLQHTATHCNTLQHTATYYNSLQHAATCAATADAAADALHSSSSVTRKSDDTIDPICVVCVRVANQYAYFMCGKSEMIA